MTKVRKVREDSVGLPALPALSALLGHKVRKACKAKRGETAAVTVVIDGTGAVLGATSTERFGACASKVLTGRTLERVESRTVRVTYDFVW